MIDGFTSADRALPSEEYMLALLAKTCETAWRLPLSRSDLDEWLSNFSGDVHTRSYERQLALWFLVNFVYYNYEEVIHLSKVLFRKFLHDRLELQRLSGGADVRTATAEMFERVLFYQLGRAGESGGFLLYLFRHVNSLPVASFVTSRERIPDKVDTIVFLDDVCLSGSQAKKYLRDDIQDLKELDRVVLTLLATPEARQLLRQDNTRVITGHLLDERSQCFSPKANMFAGYECHQPAAKVFALHYGKRAWAGNPLGYNNDGYAFGFFYNTPDNTLPIFWSDQDGWKPIMKRYDKKYGSEVDDEFGAYI